MGVFDDGLAWARSVCLALPAAYEQEAWVGTRWRIRNNTFAHVLEIVDGYPPAFAAAAGTDGPATVLTFRPPGHELALTGTCAAVVEAVGYDDDLHVVLVQDRAGIRRSALGPGDAITVQCD